MQVSYKIPNLIIDGAWHHVYKYSRFMICLELQEAENDFLYL